MLFLFFSQLTEGKQHFKSTQGSEGRRGTSLEEGGYGIGGKYSSGWAAPPPGKSASTAAWISSPASAQLSAGA